MQVKNFKVAIDGPSASGKSTAASKLADKLGFATIDGGSFYRVVTYLALEKFGRVVDETNKEYVKFLENIKIEVKEGKMFGNGSDVTKYLKRDNIDAAVGLIAKQPIVRKRVSEFEHKTIKTYEGGLVMNGRVIGTVIMPEADIKFYITASAKTRAERRHKEQPEIQFESVLKDIEDRDYEDLNRKIDPMKIAKDAIVVENDNMTLNETVQFLYDEVMKKLNV